MLNYFIICTLNTILYMTNLFIFLLHFSNCAYSEQLTNGMNSAQQPIINVNDSIATAGIFSSKNSINNNQNNNIKNKYQEPSIEIKSGTNDDKNIILNNSSYNTTNFNTDAITTVTTSTTTTTSNPITNHGSSTDNSSVLVIPEAIDYNDPSDESLPTSNDEFVFHEGWSPELYE